MGRAALVLALGLSTAASAAASGGQTKLSIAVYPKGVANPKVIVNLPVSITPNAGARLYGVQESLVGGA